MKIIYTNGGFPVEGHNGSVRNARYFEKVEACDAAVVAGDYPHIVEAYKAAGIDVELLTDADNKGDYDSLTVDQIKQLLDERGVEYKASASKKELFELLTDADS